MQHFESKKDLFLSLIFLFGFLVGAGGIVIDILDPDTEVDLLTYITTTAILGFLLWVYFFTYYELTNKGLRVVCGPYRRMITYEKITGVEASRTLVSGPALSLDRVKVTTTGMLPIIISPLEKEKFIKKLEEKLAKAKK